MEQKVASRRSSLSLAALVPIPAYTLRACGSSGPGDTSSGTPIKPTYFQNDAYKTKIKTAIGAGQAPTIIYGWGGGTLRTYAEAGQVEELFDQAGAEPPAPWDDLVALTKTFNDMGVAPLSLGGQSRWISTMWLTAGFSK